jgi:anaerobic selenocysteine-containing dehydrogenase
VKGGKISSIRGDAEHPANFGKLCPKPTGLPEAIHSAHRLTHPLRRTSGGYLARISWDEAVDELSARGSFEERAVISDSVRPGTVFATFHWGELWTSGGGVNEATHGEVCPISKQPELNGAAVRLQPVATGEPESDEQRDYLGSASKTRGIA